MNTMSFRFYRLGMRTLGTLAPALGARAARARFLRPRRFAPRGYETGLAAPDRILSFGPGLRARQWGDGEEKILLLHGWEGRYSQFAALIPEIVARGLSAVTIDPPAHGHSAGGRAHPVAFAEALLAAGRELGPARAVVGHSMGAAATVYALHRGLRTERAIMIAAPIAVKPILEGFASIIGLPTKAQQRFVADVEAHVGTPTAALDCERLARVRSEPALIVHDRDDREIPVRWGHALARAWPDAELHETRGLGHRRILADPATCARVAAFATVAAKTGTDHGRAAGIA